MKDVSTGPPVQLTLLSPTIEMLLLLSYAATFVNYISTRLIDSTCLGSRSIQNNYVKLFIFKEAKEGVVPLTESTKPSCKHLLVIR